MKKSIAVTAVCAAIFAAFAVPAAAYADEDPRNANARVAGVTARDAGDGCPPGNFCLYTGPNYSGRVFRLFHCREYALSNWGGYGSWYNHNTGGAHGMIYDSDHSLLVDSDPATNNQHPAFDFDPAWYVRAC